MDGFTGIDFNTVERKIDNIHSSIYIAMKQIDGFIGNEFFPKLRKNWASDNAVKFANELQEELNGYLRTIGTLGDRIISDLDNSASKYAVNTGATYRSASFSTLAEYKMMTNLVLDRCNENGVTGMNTTLVLDLLNNELDKIRSYADKLDASLPLNIDFFDTNNEQNDSYISRRTTIINTIYDILNKISSDILSYIETEKHNILLAKQQVIQNMNGSSSTNA